VTGIPVATIPPPMSEVPTDAGRIPARSGPRAAIVRGHLAVRRPQNWLELIRYCTVGASGYVLNLATFTVANVRLAYQVAFVIAFVVSATSNFV
jgi:hypothetical protein